MHSFDTAAIGAAAASFAVSSGARSVLATLYPDDMLALQEQAATEAVAAAAALVFGYKQVALIKAQKYESSSTGASAGGASAGIAPSAPNVAGMQAPQIQTGQGANPTTQLGQTLTNAQKPIRAYVVSQDIQSQTALDRRTNRAATFSGG